MTLSACPEQCQSLLRGLKEPWRGNTELYVRILNQEAGAAIFLSTDPEELRLTWATGKLLRREQLNPSSRIARLKLPPGTYRGLIETPAMQANLAFFDDVEAGQVRPHTLLNFWDLKRHEAFGQSWFGSQNLGKVRALVAFRMHAGRFPLEPVPVMRALTEQDKKAIEREKEYLTKHGIKTSGSSLPLGDQAFTQAMGIEDRDAKLSAAEKNRRSNLAADAWGAYDQIRNGDFLDDDSLFEQDWERQKEWNRQNNVKQ